MAETILSADKTAINEKASLAIFGQQLVKDGIIIPAHRLTGEFADVEQLQRKYQHSFIGLSKTGDIIVGVIGGDRSRGAGLMVDDMARFMKGHGVFNGILLANGGDVNIRHNNNHIITSLAGTENPYVRTHFSAVIAVAISVNLGLQENEQNGDGPVFGVSSPVDDFFSEQVIDYFERLESAETSLIYLKRIIKETYGSHLSKVVGEGNVEECVEFAYKIAIDLSRRGIDAETIYKYFLRSAICPLVVDWGHVINTPKKFKSALLAARKLMLFLVHIDINMLIQPSFNNVTLVYKIIFEENEEDFGICYWQECFDDVFGDYRQAVVRFFALSE